jgi:phosphoglycerate dehydrogenase-like enzyme
MKVVVTEHLLTDAYLRDLRASFPGIAVEPARTVDEQIREIADAEVFCGSPTSAIFRAARRLRWVHCPGTGIDWLAKVPELVHSDVVLTNARGPHTEPMADHLFAMLLALTHHIRELAKDQEAHRWHASTYHHQMVELHGKTMGILALGGLGMAAARRASGFGMKVYAVDVQPLAKPPEVEAVWGPDRLDDLLRISDVFVVTAPFTEKTRGLIDRRRIGLLKPDSYLFVISRGGIVDEDALVEALQSQRLAGAGLDVTSVEPLPPDSPLWDVHNLILSPHVSAYTPEMLEGRRQVFKENVRRYLAGEPFLYVCDKKAGF